MFESGKISQSFLHHTGCTVALGVPKPALSPGTVQALRVWQVPALQLYEMRSLAALGTAALTFLLALLCPCWYFAMTEIGKPSRAQCKSEKIREDMGNHLLTVCLKSKCIWNFSLLQGKTFC